MNRLDVLLPWIDGHKVLLDVGTDHAKLPMQAIKRTSIQKAYASDNKPGPLKVAKTRILEADLDAHVSVLEGDGLEVLKEDVDVVTIAGLGGSLIQSMLLKDSLKNVETLIIQPTNKVSSIRAFTELMPWMIVDEMITVDKEIPYISLMLKKGCDRLSEKERLFGRILTEKKDPTYKDLLEKDFAFLNTLLEQIPDDKKPEAMKRKATYLKEILDDWS